MIITGANSLWPILREAPSCPNNVLTSECRAVIWPWIEDCLKNHIASRTQSASYPTRLVETVDSHTSPERLRIKRLTVDDGQVRYLTLSHCWAESKAADSKTLIQNCMEREKYLPMENLSKTFRDAIQVTLWLGYRYILIDSLCIAQDGEDEKLKELSIMGDIYAGSDITLAAQYFPDSFENHGMFLSRDTYLEVMSTGPGETRFPTFVKPLFPHGVEHQRALTGRALCVQERLLSPRVLHFRKWEVMFECANPYHCECEEVGFAQPHRDGDEQEKRLKHTLFGVHEPDKTYWNVEDAPENLESEAWDNWHTIVEEYTRANLSFPADKLPALSSVAARMPEEWGRTLPAYGPRTSSESYYGVIQYLADASASAPLVLTTSLRHTFPGPPSRAQFGRHSPPPTSVERHKSLGYKPFLKTIPIPSQSSKKRHLSNSNAASYTQGSSHPRIRRQRKNSCTTMSQASKRGFMKDSSAYRNLASSTLLATGQ
ncbi:Heterokaryon incompatibility [Macrophomina phaseolina MS6]|uniref:Heterokaryon incompatibility n=1 Tax=Macrophomina phaseolina (strain MS6) TaxID=1126212 RepID=K2SC92_MACPH|nr:Heterokaryon incompatibility [Macrophomina phaseolina MS6]